MAVSVVPNTTAVMTFDRLVMCDAENLTDAAVLCMLNLPLETQVQDLADRGARAVIFQSVSCKYLVKPEVQGGVWFRFLTSVTSTRRFSLAAIIKFEFYFCLSTILTRVNFTVFTYDLAAILGFTNFLRQGKTVPLVLPTYEVHGDDFSKIASNLDTNDVVVQDVVLNPQLNRWISTFASPGLYVMQILLGVISLGLIVFGATKFRAVLQWFNGCRLSITYVLIWLEIIANFRK